MMRLSVCHASLRTLMNAHSGDVLSGLAAKDTSSRVRPVVGCGSLVPLRYAYSIHTGSWREGRRNGLIPCALAMVVVLTLLGKFLKQEVQ